MSGGYDVDPVTKPSGSTSAVDDVIDQARRRNEELIAKLVALLCTISIPFVWSRFEGMEFLGVSNQLIAIGMAIATTAYYLRVAARARVTRVSRGVAWTRTTIETVVPLVLLITSWKDTHGLTFASAAPLLFGLSLLISTLRLDPALSLYSGLLSAIGQGAIYFGMDEIVPTNIKVALPPSVMMLRTLYITLGGVVAFVVARNLRDNLLLALREQRQHERVADAFGSYVDRRVVQRVLHGDLTITPERRNVTVMFVDIRGFTSLSEKSDPATVFRMLNGALDAFATEVQRQGGIVNKFLGDGLMAIFGAPEPQEDHARRAVRAGLQIAAEAAQRAADGRFTGLKIGVGIHTGDAILGDLGGERREYTAIGDVVNVASRVESANKELGTTVLVTEATRAAIGAGAELKVQPPIALKGREEKIELYEVRGLRGTATHEIESALGGGPVGSPR